MKEFLAQILVFIVLLTGSYIGLYIINTAQGGWWSGLISGSISMLIFRVFDKQQ